MKSKTMKTRMDDTAEIQIQELINKMICAPDEYKHLQIFLHRNRKIDVQSEMEFLMVSPRYFGKVEITDLFVQGDVISVEFHDCATQELGTVNININEKNPSILFINWNDIKSIVKTDISAFMDNSGILEFDF